MKRQVKVSVGRSVGYSVSESVGEGASSISSAPAETGLLATYPNALVALSTARQLRSGWTSALIRVRRSSDNAEQDISFTAAGGLDETGLLAFVGANDGLITTVYDQSGNARDAVQTTAGNQPPIVVAGVLQTFGSNLRPAPLFSSAANRRLATAAFNHGTQQLAAFLAFRKNDEDVYAQVVNFGSPGASQNGSWWVESPLTGAQPQVAFRVRGNAAPGSLVLGSITAPADLVMVCVANTDAPPYRRQVRINTTATVSSTASLVATGNTISATFTTYALGIGADSSTFSQLDGLIGEVIVYGTVARASTSAGLDTNLKTFWGIV